MGKQLRSVGPSAWLTIATVLLALAASAGSEGDSGNGNLSHIGWQQPASTSPSFTDSLSTPLPVRTNRACDGGKCVVCPVNAVCILSDDATDPSNYRKCIRTTTNQVGWLKGTCPTCVCQMLTARELEILRPTFFTRERMWYACMHTHSFVPINHYDK